MRIEGSRAAPCRESASATGRHRPFLGGRRALPRARYPGGVLPHLQRPVRGGEADRPDLRPAPRARSRARGPAGEPLRVGHGGFATSASDLEHRIAILRGSWWSRTTRDDHPGRRAPVHRRARPLQRPSPRAASSSCCSSLAHTARPIELACEALADKIRLGRPRGHPATFPTIDRSRTSWPGAGGDLEQLRLKARSRLLVPRQDRYVLARDILQMQLIEIGQASAGATTPR